MEAYKERPLSIGDRVKVYLNWNKGVKGVDSWFSIASFEIGKGALVVGYSQKVTLMDAKFVVAESTRQRVIHQGQKEICGWVEGILVAYDQDKPAYLETPAYFEPYTCSFFKRPNGDKVESATVAHLQARRVWI